MSKMPSRKTQELKAGFKLDCKDGWPPSESEFIWLERDDENFRVKTFPFFIKGLAYNDLISAEIDDEQYVSKWLMLEPSEFSTLWVFTKNDKTIQDFEKLGCGVEGGAIKNYFSVNIHKNVDKQKLSMLLDKCESKNLAEFAFPAWRIDV